MPDQLSTKEPVLVFIHLPKTGGTTLNHIFLGNFLVKRCFIFGIRYTLKHFCK